MGGSIRVENGSAVLIRSLEVSAPYSEAEQLPSPGLPPGEAVTIYLPCYTGAYTFRVTFADGRVEQYPDLDPMKTKVLAVR